MGDPLTGLATVGAVSALLQVIDFSAKVISQTTKLLNSSDDTLRENIMVESLTLEHSALADRVISDGREEPPLNSNEQAIDNLARQCKQESAKLLKQLDELKVAKDLIGAKRVWQSVRKTSRALKKRKDIEQQQNGLEKLHNRLSEALLHGLRTTQSSGFKDVLERIDRSDGAITLAVLDSKQAILQAMNDHVQRTNDSLKQYFDNHLTQQQKHEKVRLIVDNLRFPEMRLRRDAIPQAHKETFKWIFENDTSLFKAWLTSSEDLFWISGKPGSGKSTLMKYLSSHSQTKDCLKKWSGASPLVVIDSYFWNPGTALQQNEQGLLQQIIFCMLNSDPNLVEIASPDRWKADLIYHRRPDLWSLEELRDALQRILTSPRNQNWFCFFIDGLDEYHQEHSRLVARVKDLAKDTRIKICCSARPWNVFRTAFGSLTSKFYLEDLTREDIRLYVQEELGGLPQDDSLTQSLTSRIVHKAQGVFLWVFLVVRSLREGLDEDDSPSYLHQRVDEIPTDLEEYFKLILRRIGKTYQRQTYKALKLATLTMGENIPHLIMESNDFLTYVLAVEAGTPGQCMSRI